MADQILTQEYLHKLFEYFEGHIYWKIANSNRVKVGDRAGYLDDSRIFARINRKLYLVHRIIFFMHQGYLPELIDHEDRNSLNNKIENLREATKSQNANNSKVQKNNTSGVKGVYWNKSSKKWHARLKVNGKTMSFGYYKDINYAKFVIDAMRYKYHGEFASNGK
jgi:hypothetical protein